MKGFRFSDWMSMARGSNLPTVWTNILAAWGINAGAGPSLRWMPEWTNADFFDGSTFAWLILGASLVYAGGCFLNDACDHQFDAEHRPERPIPRGVLTLPQAWLLGLIQLGIGTWALITGAGCAWHWAVALMGCILAYNWLHKKTAFGIVLMGGCRTLLWITAATAATGMSPAPLLYLWAITVGLYVVGISWFARTESLMKSVREEGYTWVNRLPILFLFSVPLLALAYLVLWNNLDPIRVFLVNVVGLLGGGIVFYATLTMRKKEEGSIGKGVSLLLAGICAMDATLLAFHVPLLVGPCVLLGTIAYILQKKFAAT